MSSPAPCLWCGSLLQPNQLCVTYEGPPDREGKRPFAVDWWARQYATPGEAQAQGRRCPHRGQFFRADPAPYLARWRAEGWHVIEREDPLARRP